MADLVIFKPPLPERLEQLGSGETLFDIAMDISDASESTREAYKHDLKRFARFLTLQIGNAITAMQGLQGLCTLDSGQANILVGKFRTWMRKEKLAASTIARTIRMLNSVTKSLKLAGKISWRLEAKAPKVRKPRSVKGPCAEDWVAFMKQVEGGDPLMKRDRAMFFLMGTHGLRATEVCRLNLEDIDHREKRVYVHGKGDKDRWVSMGGATWESFLEWLNVRESELAAVFVSSHGNRISRYLVHDRVEQASKNAGLTGHHRIHPHALRHRTGTHGMATAAREGIPSVGVQNLLGHEDPKTTEGYVDDAEDHAARLGRILGRMEGELHGQQ